jgi:hypothetical protein
MSEWRQPRLTVGVIRSQNTKHLVSSLLLFLVVDDLFVFSSCSKGAAIPELRP